MNSTGFDITPSSIGLSISASETQEYPSQLEGGTPLIMQRCFALHLSVDEVKRIIRAAIENGISIG